MSLKNPIALECTWEFPIRNHFLPLQALKYPLLSLDAAKPFFSLWQNYALYKVITTDNTGQKEIHSSPVVLLREENLLR